MGAGKGPDQPASETSVLKYYEALRRATKWHRYSRYSCAESG